VTPAEAQLLADELADINERMDRIEAGLQAIREAAACLPGGPKAAA
jgi:hypothetical protein